MSGYAPDVEDMAASLGISLPGTTLPVSAPQVRRKNRKSQPRRPRPSRAVADPVETKVKRQASVEAIAAQRTGTTVGERRDRVAHGWKWCTAHKEWHPREEFGRDRYRADGLDARCLRSKRTGGRCDDAITLRSEDHRVATCTRPNGHKGPHGDGTTAWTDPVHHEADA